MGAEMKTREGVAEEAMESETGSEEGLTLEKFEEASEVVKKVTL